MWFFDFLSDSWNKTMNDLEDVNLWRPKNPNVEINPKTNSEKIPQAWEYYENWYYNFPWAIAETQYLGKRMPTKNEWKQIIKWGWLNLPLLGSNSPYDRDHANGIDHVLSKCFFQLISYWEWGHYWSSSRPIEGDYLADYWTYSLSFSLSYSSVYTHKYACAMSVRCFKN